MLRIDRNSNTNDESTLSGAIALNTSTSTTVVSANTDRINVTISNPSQNLVWIKFQASGVDNDKKGITLFGRSVFEMTPDNLYTGEISAIADTGTPDIYVTEY